MPTTLDRLAAHAANKPFASLPVISLESQLLILATVLEGMQAQGVALTPGAITGLDEIVEAALEQLSCTDKPAFDRLSALLIDRADAA